MVYNLRINKNQILFLIILIPIFIDQVNGFMQRELLIQASLSQFVKMIYTLVFMGLLAAYSRNKFIILLLMFLILTLPFLNNVYCTTLSNAYKDIVFYTKLMTFPLSYLLFSELLKRNPSFVEKYYSKIYIILFITLSAAIILSLFGFGKTNYGESSAGIAYGYRGYFIAGNEVSALYTLLYALLIYHVYYNKKPFAIILGANLLGLITALLMVTKTVLVSFLVTTLLIPFLIHIYYKKKIYVISQYQKKLINVIIFVVLISITLLYAIFRDRIQANIDRTVFNIQQTSKIYSFLVSGRDIRIYDSIKLYTDKYTLAEKIIGTGWRYPVEYIVNKYNGVGSSEIDWLDILVSNGIIGVIIMYGFWLYVLFIICKQFYNARTPYTIPLLLSFVLLLINSFMGGHIIYSAMVGLYLGFFTSVLNLPEV